MTTHRIRIVGAALLGAASFTVTPSANAAGVPSIADLEEALEEGKDLYQQAKKIEQDYNSLSSDVKAKLKAKKQRLKNAAKSFMLVADAVKKGKPLPLYITKSGGVDVACGDMIWLHNVAQDKVLKSTKMKNGKPLFIAVNVDWKSKSSVASPNLRVECLDKKKGEPLAYGDKFLLELTPAAGLDDGKRWFHAGTKVGYDPVVRLGDMAEIEKWKAYWFFRGGEGNVQSGIPMEIVATNRKDDGNVGGFCGSGPGGVLQVIAFNMSNHCGHVELGAGIARDGIAAPPQWTKDLVKEAKALIDELRREIEKAGGGGSSSGTTTPKPKLPFG